jgi:glucose-1-phosphate thymidylyltransferase
MFLYAIVLAGGYAKRLWPLTLGKPKALLPIAGKPILDHIIEKLQALNPPLSKIVLSTNMLFQPQFQEWMTSKACRNIELVPDDSTCETQKLGAIKAMANIVAVAEEDDVLVIAGDGMFNDNLAGMLQTFKQKNAAVVALYHVRNLEEAKRCATITADQNGKIIEFTEKPAEPKTTMACGAVYVFPKKVREWFKMYLRLGLPTDQPGRFVEWLCKQEPVYGYMLKDYLWDIGTKEAYKACEEFFTGAINKKMELMEEKI